MITLGLVDSVDVNGVYVTMPGSRGVLRGPFASINSVAIGSSVLVVETDDGEQVVVGVAGAPRDVHNVRDYGATGSGTVDDSSAVQAAIDAAAVQRGLVYFPPGDYVVDGTVTMLDCDDLTVQFSSDAWLKPSDGYALTVDDSERVRVHGLRVKFEGGTPTGGLLVTASPRTTVTDPVVYLWDDDAGTPDGIVVDDNSYWCEVVRPRMRKLSGGITNDIANGVVFKLVSNAGRVVGGDFSNCTVGVLVEDANSVAVDGTAFETCDTGIELLDNSNNAALRVTGCRFESVTTAVSLLNNDLTSLPTMIGDNTYVGITTVLNNPNALPVQVKDNASIHLVGSGYGFTSTHAIVEVTPFDQATPAFRVNGRFPYTEDPTFLVTATGGISLGDGSGAPDIHLTYASGGLKVDSSALGFFNTTPTSKPTVTGSRGGNAALASLLTALANLGLITDSSS